MTTSKNAARVANKLTARQVDQIREPGTFADGEGLFLQVSSGRSGIRKSWLVRYTAPDGRRREMGLGRLDQVDLKTARDKAQEARRLAANGEDPLQARDEAKKVMTVKARQGLIFADAVKAYLAMHEASWKNAKHAQQWRNTLATYAIPILGDLSVSEIDTPQILEGSCQRNPLVSSIGVIGYPPRHENEHLSLLQNVS